MASILSSQGMVLATAMAAVSGTVILLAFRLQKSPELPQAQRVLRSCISSDGNKKRDRKKKRVHFAEDVVDPRGNGDEFRKQHHVAVKKAPSSTATSSSPSSSKMKRTGGMPENRVALYNGILRDRMVHHRLAYSC